MKFNFFDRLVGSAINSLQFLLVISYLLQSQFISVKEFCQENSETVIKVLQSMTQNDCSLKLKEQSSFTLIVRGNTGQLLHSVVVPSGTLTASILVCFHADEVKRQLRALYGHLMKNLKVMVVRVQRQQGTVDCGLFAITYAVSLANGKDTAKMKFAQQSMRAFFADCIKNRHLDTFPTEKEIACVARPDTVTL